MTECIICHLKSSVFWWPFSFGDSSGEICEECMMAMRTVIVCRRRKVMEDGE